MQAKTALVAVLVVSAFLGCNPKGSHDEGVAAKLTAIVKKKPLVFPPQTLARLGDDVRRSGALLLAKTGERAVALVTDADDTAIDELDLETGALLTSTKLTSAPRGGLVLGDGTVAVVLPEENAVAVLARHVDGRRYREVRRFTTPDDPRALALSPDDTTLYLTSGATHTLVAYDAKGGKELGRADLPRGPRGMTTSADGSKIYVSHATFGATTVAMRDALLKGEAKPTAIAQGAGSCGGAAAPSPEADCMTDFARHGHVLLTAVVAGEEQVLAPLVEARPRPTMFASKMATPMVPRPRQGDLDFEFGSGSSQDFGGGGITGYGVSASSGPPEHFELRAVSVANQKSSTVSGTMFAGPKCLLPVAALQSKRTGLVYVACSGTTRVESITTDTTLKRAITVSDSPEALALSPDGRRLMVWSATSRTLSAHVLDARHEPFGLRLETPLNTKLYGSTIPRVLEKDADWLSGRSLFAKTFDARISADGRACASCHVDGGDDAIVWSTPQGKRRTRTLEGQLGTGPYGWQGEHKTLAEHVRMTERQLGGTGLPDAERDNLVAYVRTLGAPKRTAPKDLGAEAKKGRELFVSEKYDCATCHTGGGFDSDRAVHDVGSGGKFVTPTLAGVATRPQLFHDGAYPTLDALLAKSKGMGRASEMTPDERQAMTAYLATL
jgi:mono/diheme cytochrome c family protein